MDHVAVDPTFSRQDERGRFMEIVNRGPWETVITGQMNPGAVLGNHYHARTDMFFFLTHGQCRVDLISVKTGRQRGLDLDAGQGVHLPRFHSHAIRFEEDSTFILLKSVAYDPQDPDMYEYPVPQEAPAIAEVT